MLKHCNSITRMLNFYSIYYLFIILFLSGCNSLDDDYSSIENIETTNSTTFRSSDDIVDAQTLVDSHITNLRDFYYSVESFITAKNNLSQAPSSSNINPIDSIFIYLDIIDDDTNDEICVTDMEKDELNAFINNYLENERTELNNLLNTYPELTSIIQEEVELYQAIKGITTRNANNNVISYDEFIAAYQNVTNSNEGYSLLHNKPRCPYCGRLLRFVDENCICRPIPVDPEPHPEPPPINDGLTIAQRRLATGIKSAGAKRGDILLTLAGDDGSNFVHPVFLGATYSNANINYKVGHAGIIDFSPSSSASNAFILDGETIEAWESNYENRKTGNQYSKQVMHRTVSDWDNATAVYVLGVQYWKIRWKWRGLQSRFYYVYNPVESPESLAVEANKWIGKPYSARSSFGWSKHRAPHSFQCASLVWYSAKKAYGCRLAPYLSPTVTPANLLFDRNSYIKSRIIVEPK